MQLIYLCLWLIFQIFFLINLESIKKIKNYGIRDLISHYRGLKYFNETLKLLQKFNTNIYIPDTIENVTSIGFIHV